LDGTDDQRLMGCLAAGDTKALGALYDRHANAVFGLLVRMLGDRPVAEELLQEAFVRGWRHAASYDSARGQVRPWLMRIAHNLALNELRRRRRRPHEVVTDGGADDDVPLLAAVPDPGPEPAEAAWAAVRRVELVHALEQLSEPQRAVIELYATGYSQSEIAARLGEPLGTVKTRMRRALHQLRATLQASGLLEPE